MTDLAEVRAKAARRELDMKTWDPRDALKAALADIESGDLDPEALVIIYASPAGVDRIKTGRYASSTSRHGKRDTFWMWGMIQKALADWMQGN